MAKSRDGCHICGGCWWVDCENEADYTMDVSLRRHGAPLYDGKVDLCAGHTRLVHSNGGRLDLDWTAVEQAKALVKVRV